MTHPDEDTLLQFILRTLGEPDDSGVREHLSRCAECRALEQKMQQELARLQEIEIRVDTPGFLRLPVLADAPARHWRWVAGLAAGFLLGILTARLADSGPPAAVPQRLTTQAVSSPPSAYIPCRAVDLKTALRP